MNYQANYDALIARAKIRLLDGYSERHHVVPRCLGGSDVSSNIVNLTPEEHYVAHQLLVKIHPDSIGLVTAASLMSKRCSGSRAYGWLRRRISETRKGKRLSENTRAKISIAKLGHQYGPNSAEHNAKIAAAKLGKRLSKKHIEKISASRKGVPWTAARRACLENSHGA
jgi:hypothetical protein